MVALIAMKLMETGLGPKAAKLASWAIVALLALLALWWAYNHAYSNGRDDERARWEAAAARIEAADAKADAAGTAKAGEVKKGIDDANQRAADAALDSSDPLRDGIGELRKQSAGKGGQAPR
ncbi:hypothetical protein [Sphingopyxis sp. JAI128]|uniref:hypothetical protein n=1 Tax=Sphingopyxis sp. JAI128 TaxID=2723066 RepID=UPI001615716F|nr:hypothetical protein [Sphingopyxis sp. JAI128]MBB6424926.1 hypothetical protein [Sphingopyxis sp. JAI128]